MPRLSKGAAVGWCVLMNGGSGGTDGWRLSAIALQWQKFNATATVAEAAVLPLRPRVHSLLPPFPPLRSTVYHPFYFSFGALLIRPVQRSAKCTFRDNSSIGLKCYIS